MSSTVEASPEQVAKVLEILNRTKPKGLMPDQIKKRTGYTLEIVYSALHVLERERTVVGRNPFAYDPHAVDNDPDDPEEVGGPTEQRR